MQCLGKIRLGILSTKRNVIHVYVGFEAFARTTAVLRSWWEGEKSGVVVGSFALFLTAFCKWLNLVQQAGGWDRRDQATTDAASSVPPSRAFRGSSECSCCLSRLVYVLVPALGNDIHKS